MYCASKHAMKGFTDALRMELVDEGAPVSVTLIKPASIDTPLPQRARNYMDREPSLPPPIYPPEEVANAILHAAVHPQRDIFVGGAGKAFDGLQGIRPGRLRSPRPGDHRLAEARRGPPRPGRRAARSRPGRRDARRSSPATSMRTSAYTRATPAPGHHGGRIGLGLAATRPSLARQSLRRRRPL